MSEEKKVWSELFEAQQKVIKRYLTAVKAKEDAESYLETCKQEVIDLVGPISAELEDGRGFSVYSYSGSPSTSWKKVIDDLKSKFFPTLNEEQKAKFLLDLESAKEDNTKKAKEGLTWSVKIDK